MKPPIVSLATLVFLAAGCMWDSTEPELEADALESVELPACGSYLDGGQPEWKDAQVVERLWPTTIDELQHVLAREAPTFLDGMICRSEDRFQLFAADLRGVGKEDILVLRERTSWRPIDDDERRPAEESCLFCFEGTNTGPRVLWRQLLESAEEVGELMGVDFLQLDSDPCLEITAYYGYREVRRIRVVEWDGLCLETRDLHAEFAFEFSDVNEDGVVEVLVRGDFMGHGRFCCCEAAKRWWYDVCSYESGTLKNVNDQNLKWFETVLERERAELSRLQEIAESSGREGFVDFDYMKSASEEIIARCEVLISTGGR